MGILTDALYENLHFEEDIMIDKQDLEDTEEKADEKDLDDRIDSLEEEMITEEKLVEIPYEDEMIMQEELNEDLITEDIPVARKFGSAEYDSNEGRIQRVNHFRKLANLSDDEPITESLLEEKDWAVKQTACQFYRPSDRIKAELLNQKYTGLEQYEN